MLVEEGGVVYFRRLEQDQFRGGGDVIEVVNVVVDVDLGTGGREDVGEVWEVEEMVEGNRGEFVAGGASHHLGNDEASCCMVC